MTGTPTPPLRDIQSLLDQIAALTPGQMDALSALNGGADPDITDTVTERWHRKGLLHETGEAATQARAAVREYHGRSVVELIVDRVASAYAARAEFTERTRHQYDAFVHEWERITGPLPLEPDTAMARAAAAAVNAPDLWGPTEPQAPLTHTLLELHRQTVGWIAARAKDTLGYMTQDVSQPRLDNDTFTIIVRGPRTESTKAADPIIRDLIAHGYAAATTGTRPDGTQVSIDATTLPRSVYEDLPESSRTLIADILTRAASQDRARLDEQEFQGIGHDLAALCEPNLTRVDLHLMLRLWMQSAPDPKPQIDRDVMAKVTSHLLAVGAIRY